MDVIYSVNILSHLSVKKAELLNYLNSLHKSLSGLSQNAIDHPKGLTKIAQQIISERILSYSDKDVVLLVSCCIVDILRVYAPDAPYKDEEMVRVFSVIFAQLRLLSTYDKNSATVSS
jgi:sister-chromatid-cohesion protein PDS5